MKKTKKICDTSTRVLETLKVLVRQDSSIQEIISHFEKINSNNRIYTNEVILKYINTLKVFGFKFAKKKDKYVILNPPNQFSFDVTDLKALCLIEKIIKVFPEENVKEEVIKFVQDVEKRLSDESRLIADKIINPDCFSINIDYEKYASIIKIYEKYCLDNQKIKITYNTDNNVETSIIAEPIEFKYMEDNVYFRIYNPVFGSIQDIAFGDIVEILQLPVKVNSTSILSTSTFRIKGRLAQNYMLHDGERVVKTEVDGSKIVLNQKEDKKFLLRRLMRYGANCEVISPESLKKEMIVLIKKTLKNYNKI